MTFGTHTKAVIAAIALTSIFGTALAPAAPISTTGGGDCYNRVTQGCNKGHPGKDWGDQVYRDCINTGLDKCDKEEPVAHWGIKLHGLGGRVPTMMLSR